MRENEHEKDARSPDSDKNHNRSQDQPPLPQLLTPYTRTATITIAWLQVPASSRPRRLARPRTSPFHGGNTGSNPVGDANKIKYLQEPQFPTRYALRYGLVCE